MTLSATAGQQHTAAVLVLAATAGVRLFEGEAPSTAALPYAVLYADTGRPEAERMTANSDRLVHTFQITSVGTDRAGAMAVSDKVRAALLDKRPVVTGRTAWPIRQVSAQPLRRDDSQTQSLLYLVDVYAWSTTPAPA